MNSFRMRQQLQTEGFGEPSSVEAIEAVSAEAAVAIGESEAADNEVAGLLDEGELLSNDTTDLEGQEEVVEEVEEAGEEITPEHADTISLVTESFCRSWGITSNKRKLATENFTGKRGDTKLLREGLGDTIAKGWETFYRWCQDIVDTIVSKYKTHFGTGQSLIKASEKFGELLTKRTTADKDKVSAGYEKFFVMDGGLDIETSIAIGKSLLQVTSEIDAFCAESLLNGVKIIELSQSEEGKRFDQVAGQAKDAPKFGKKIARKLSPVGGKDGKNEQQFVFALPANNYLQGFSYDKVINKGEDATVTIAGSRFIKAGDSISKADEANKEVTLIATAKLVEYNTTLGVVGNALKEIEVNTKKTREASRTILDAIKAQGKKAKAADKKDKGHYRATQMLARESFVSAQHLNNAITTTATVLGKGLSKLLGNHIGGYKAA